MRTKLNLLLLALVCALVLQGGIKSAYAYFTTYVEARGGYAIDTPSETEVKEEFSAWTKRVSIKNEGDAGPVFVRAKAFCTAKYPLTYTATGAWTLASDGWYYYNDPVPSGSETSELRVKIEDVPRTAEPGVSFNVVVVYESTPVRTREDGTTYADWGNISGSGESRPATPGQEGGAA